jgi:hypothetical protein
MRILLPVLALLSFGTAVAADAYPVSAIPLQLLKNADRVVRLQEQQFEIISTHETVLREHFVLTILKESADEHAQLQVPYGKLMQVTSIEGALYDAYGKQLRKLKSKEVRDYSAVDDISLIDDSRMKVHNFNYNIYPYTVEYEVVTRFNNSYFFPGWIPVEGEHVAVERSRYTVTAPETYNLRYKAFLYKDAPKELLEKGKRSLSWELQSVPAFERPYAAPPWRELLPNVKIAPSQFEVEGYKGDGSSWESLGMFQLALNRERDKLPEPLVKQVKELVKDARSDEEKARILYAFLQKNTRYISIQLGIGGWQPFEAAFVAQKGYGDCKALSNYMYSMLKAAGVRSHYTWVHAGDSRDDKFMVENFPSLQFNHIILCVPLPNDTLWLECTSQTAPAGYMGSFTGNRKVIAITEEGGKVVSTPRYGLNENLQLRHISGKLDEQGVLEAKVATRYFAEQQDELQMRHSNMTKDRMLEYLNKRFNLPTYEVLQYNYTEIPARKPELKEDLTLMVSGYASVTGKRLFIAPNLLTREARSLSKEPRTVDIDLDMSYRDIDSVELELPAGYTIESMPEPVRLQSKFGTYESVTKLQNGKLLFTRKREQFGGRYPAADFNDFAAFVNEIYKADRKTLVLVKQ